MSFPSASLGEITDTYGACYSLVLVQSSHRDTYNAAVCFNVFLSSARLVRMGMGDALGELFIFEAMAAFRPEVDDLLTKKSNLE